METANMSKPSARHHIPRVALEESGVLPADSVSYSARLVDRMGDSARRAWHRDALSSLVAADLVFVDPDNGLRNEHRGSKAGKLSR
jgi:hypothetical protein